MTLKKMPCSLLEEIHETSKVTDANGNVIQLHSHLPRPLCVALYQTVLELKPVNVIEVGMAYGISTLAILAALKELGGERKLISIDPAQHSSEYWKGIGVLNVERAGFSHLHELIEEPDYYALPRLMQEKRTYEFGYIDGVHSFDYAFLDFFFVDQLLAVNGVLAFNDSHRKSVQRVMKFLVTHREYQQIFPDFQPTPTGKPALDLLKKIYWGLRKKKWIDRYFVKKSDWKAGSDFYKPF